MTAFEVAWNTTLMPVLTKTASATPLNGWRICRMTEREEIRIEIRRELDAHSQYLGSDDQAEFIMRRLEEKWQFKRLEDAMGSQP